MFNRRTITTLALSGALALGASGAAQAKHGSDDPAGHDAGDDHGRHHARHGADDGVVHLKRHQGRKHHRHGNDDGPNHT